MMRLSEFRKRGVIPARRHDAFLLAMLLSLTLCVLLFTLQALLPRIAALISLVAPNPTPMVENEYALPFILVDPSLIDDVDPELPAEAEGNVNRLARQAEAVPDLPEESATIDTGGEVLLTLPEGNPGPDAPEGNADADAAPPETARMDPEEVPEPAETAEPMPLSPEPELPPLPEPFPEPAPSAPLPQTEAPPPMPEPIPTEMIPEPSPEPLPPEEPEPPQEPVVESPSAPEADSLPEPESNPPEPAEAELVDAPDVAMLAVSPDGFMDQSTRTLRDRASEPLIESQPMRMPLRLLPDELEEPRFAVPAFPPPVPDAPPPETPAPRPGSRPQPTFKKIGGEANRAGAPLRRNRDSSVKLLGDDASMRILQHRYGAYMEKVARQLQESLNRQSVLSPTAYSRGQVKIRFGISPDGSLTYYETVYAAEGMDAERVLSEKTVVEAAPFDPLTPEMQKDENFQKLTVTVNLM